MAQANAFTRVFLFFMALSISCLHAQDQPDAAVNQLIKDLKSVKGKGVLFGHQDDLAYGIGWRYIKGESDVKRVSGDYPALFGWELGGLELDHEYNLDSVPFDKMEELAIMGHQMGGINTFSWHPYAPVSQESAWSKQKGIVAKLIPGGEHHEAFKNQLDKIARFFLKLKDAQGNQIPFIFRPWHEMDGSWFWWGSEQCSNEEFKQLFAFTVDYLRREKEVKHMVVAYSPDRNFDSEKSYLQWYPGDSFVDILGVDNYYDLKRSGGVSDAIAKLHLVIEIAHKKDKLCAFTETGSENVSTEKWYTQRLGRVLADPVIAGEISYVMVWRNDDRVHYFFPYPGHKEAADAKELLEDPNILLLTDYNGLK